MVLALSDPGAPATFSEFFKRLRRTRGSSLSQIARVSGVAKSTLSRWESGQSEPDLPTLQAVLESLGLGSTVWDRALAVIDAPRARTAPTVAAVFADVDVSEPGQGDLLQALRVRSGHSSAQAAEFLGVSAPTLSRWETGARAPELGALARAADAFGASPEERQALFSRHPSAPPVADFDAIHTAIDALARRLGSGIFTNADLDAISLQRQAMRLVASDERAVSEVARILALRGATAGEQGRLKEAVKWSWQSLDLRSSAPLTESPSVAVIIWGAFVSRGARPALEFALNIGAKTEGSAFIENYILQLRLWGELKIRSELDRTYETAIRLAESRESEVCVPQIRSAYGDGLLALGDVEGCLSVLPPGSPSVIARPMHHALTVAEALLRVGDRTGSEFHLRYAREFAEARGLRNYDLDRVQALYDADSTG